MMAGHDLQAQPHARLRPLCAKDLRAVHRMLADRPLQHLLLAYPPEKGVSDASRWMDRRASGGAIDCMAIARCETDAFCGFVQVSQIHRAGRHGWLGMALLPESRAQGLGRWAIRAWMSVLKEKEMRKLLLEVRADNDAAISLYRSERFRDVGDMREHYHDGNRYYDVKIMERCLEGDTF